MPRTFYLVMQKETFPITEKLLANGYNSPTPI